MRHLFIIAFFFLFSAICGQAQGVLRGRVVSAGSKTPMEFVTVAVCKQGEAAPIRGTITDGDGRFEVKGFPHGAYTLVVSYIGYKELRRDFSTSESKPTADIRDLFVEEDTKLLKDVKVVAQKSQMQFDLDKKVFNVDQNLSTAARPLTCCKMCRLSRSTTKGLCRCAGMRA